MLHVKNTNNLIKIYEITRVGTNSRCDLIKEENI